MDVTGTFKIERNLDITYKQREQLQQVKPGMGRMLPQAVSNHKERRHDMYPSSQY